VHVSLRPSAALAPRVAELAAVRVEGAVRAIDPDCRQLSVSVVYDDPPM
jgi:hypothetical protein